MFSWLNRLFYFNVKFHCPNLQVYILMLLLKNILDAFLSCIDFPCKLSLHKVPCIPFLVQYKRQGHFITWVLIYIELHGKCMGFQVRPPALKLDSCSHLGYHVMPVLECCHYYRYVLLCYFLLFSNNLWCQAFFQMLNLQCVYIFIKVCLVPCIQCKGTKVKVQYCNFTW